MLLAAILLAAAPTNALAQTALDEARHRYEAGQFTEALLTLARAEAATQLTVPELAELLALRATIHYATRSDADLARTLRELASFAPHYVFSETLPPTLHQAWNRARSETARTSVRVLGSPAPRSVDVQGSVPGAAGSLPLDRSSRRRERLPWWLAAAAGSAAVALAIALGVVARHD